MMDVLAYVITKFYGGDGVIGMAAAAITGVLHSDAAPPTQSLIAHESAICVLQRLKPQTLCVQRPIDCSAICAPHRRHDRHVNTAVHIHPHMHLCAARGHAS